MGLLLQYDFGGGKPNILSPSQSIKNETSDAYGFASVNLAGLLKNNTTYTLTIYGYTSQVANADSYLRTYVYDSGWSYQTWSVPIYNQRPGLTTLTFTTGSNATSYTYHISSYHFPSGSAGQGNCSTVIWYKLEEGSTSTAYNVQSSYTHIGDNSGNNRHAISYGCNLSTDSKTCLMSLDTQDSGYAQLPTLTLSSAFTICGWVKFVGSFATWARVFDFGSVANGGDYSIGLATNSTAGNLCVFGRTGGGAALPDTTLSVTAALDTWYHYAIVLNGTNLKVYWDGALVAEWTIAKSLAATYTLNYLGKSNWADPYSRKYMSDFRVYDHALSGTDIINLIKYRLSMTPDYSLCSYEFLENKNSNVMKINTNGVVSTDRFMEETTAEFIQDTNYDTLEYITATGTQYINTGINSGQNITRIDADYHRNTADAQQILFGMYTGSGTGYSYLGYTEGGTDELCYWYGSGVTVGAWTKGRKKIRLNVNGTSVYYNFNGTTNAFTSDARSGSTNYYLFGDNSNGSFIYGSKVDLYKFKIWVDKKLVRNFIPARRKSDSVIGLYDLVNKTFYTNSGSGSFEAGKTATALGNYIKLDYIQTDGNQYIDTGIYYNEDISIHMDFSNFNAAASGNIYLIGTENPLFGLCKRSDGQLAWFSRTDQMFTYDSFSTSSRYYIECGKNDFLCNNITPQPQSDSGNSAGSNTFRLFWGRYGANSVKANCRLHMCKIFDKGVLVRHFIPVKRKSDNLLGLYDLVYGTFYTNNGSGNFTAGTEVTTGINIEISDYEELEYIQATGSQQINTGVRFNMDTDACELDFCSTVLSQSGMILASNNSTNYFWFYHYAGTSAFSVYISSANAQVNVGNRSWDTRPHKMRFINKTYYLDNTYIGQDTRTLPVTDYTLYLCSWQNAYYYKGRIYGCRIWRNKCLIRDFIPVRRKSDGAIGLYDRVTQRFYANSGSDAFIAGGVVEPINYIKCCKLKENM